jgi:hypothetical protein
VSDHAGQVVAAVGLAGPAYRLGPAKLHSLADSVIATAMAISRDLGYQDVRRRSPVSSAVGRTRGRGVQARR